MGAVPEAVHLNNDQSEGGGERYPTRTSLIAPSLWFALIAELQCTSTLANSLHGMEDYALHQCVAIFVH